MNEPRSLDVLKEIRELELETAQRVDEARAEAEAAVTRAAADARRAVADARTRGTRQAEERHLNRLDAAAAEAEHIGRAGQASATELLGRLRSLLGGRIDEMVELLLETAGEDGR